MWTTSSCCGALVAKRTNAGSAPRIGARGLTTVRVIYEVIPQELEQANAWI